MRLRIHLAITAEAGTLLGSDGSADLVRDGGCDFAMQNENVAQIAVERVSPQVPFGVGLD